MTRPAPFAIIPSLRGRSSSGRAPPCQGGGSGFEPRRPLQRCRASIWMPYFFVPTEEPGAAGCSALHFLFGSACLGDISRPQARPTFAARQRTDPPPIFFFRKRKRAAAGPKEKPIWQTGTALTSQPVLSGFRCNLKGPYLLPRAFRFARRYCGG